MLLLLLVRLPGRICPHCVSLPLPPCLRHCHWQALAVPIPIHDIGANLLAGAQCYVGMATTFDGTASPCNDTPVYLNLYM